MGKSRKEKVVKVLAKEPPVFVNGMMVSTSESEDGDKVVSIQFFSTYADPRTDDSSDAVRHYHPPMVMRFGAAAALNRMLEFTVEKDNGEGGDE